jgi:hypothetical protein
MMGRPEPLIAFELDQAAAIRSAVGISLDMPFPV